MEAKDFKVGQQVVCGGRDAEVEKVYADRGTVGIKWMGTAGWQRYEARAADVVAQSSPSISSPLPQPQSASPAETAVPEQGTAFVEPETASAPAAMEAKTPDSADEASSEAAVAAETVASTSSSESENS